MERPTSDNARLLLALVLLAGGCTKLTEEKKDESEPAGDEGDPTPDDEDTKAGEPTMVSGAFLTMHCSDLDKGVSFATDGVPHRIGCLFLDKEGEPAAAALPAGDGGLQIVLADEVVTPVPYVLDASPAAWAFYFDLSKEQIAALKRVTVNVAASEAPVETTSVDWDYIAHRLFSAIAAIREERQLLDATTSPAVTVEKIHLPHLPNAAIATRMKEHVDIMPLMPADMVHMVFSTDFLVLGGMGVEHADAICTRSGRLLDPARKYLALLGTSAQSARDRTEINGPVYTTAIGLIASTEEAFWSGAEFVIGTIFSTETGYDVSTIVAGTKPNPLLTSLEYSENKAWTGTLANGGVDPAGSHCSDWTSSAAGVQGRLANLNAPSLLYTFEPEQGQNKHLRDCNRRARLLCISQ